VLCIQEEEVRAERLLACFQGYDIIGYVLITFPVLQNSTYTLILHRYLLPINLQDAQLLQIDHVAAYVIIFTNSTTVQIIRNILRTLNVYSEPL